MKGKIVAMLCILLLPLAALAIPAKADTMFAWIEPTYVGRDPYFDQWVVGYMEGTNWNFSMSWTNGYSYPINISAVRVYFSWGRNYTHIFTSPMQLAHDQTHLFTIYNMTPPVEEASELWVHSYQVWIQHTNDTVAPYAELPWQIYATGDDNFAVFSADHLACLNLWVKLDDALGSRPLLLADQVTSITKVQILYQQALMEFDLGTRIFEAGVFGQAKTHLQNADTLYGEMLDTWDTRGTAVEDAELNNLNSETNYNNALADATLKNANSTLVNSYGWLLFGLGWMFIGIGIVIYGLRRPKVAPAT